MTDFHTKWLFFGPRRLPCSPEGFCRAHGEGHTLRPALRHAPQRALQHAAFRPRLPKASRPIPPGRFPYCGSGTRQAAFSFGLDGVRCAWFSTRWSFFWPCGHAFQKQAGARWARYACHPHFCRTRQLVKSVRFAFATGQNPLQSPPCRKTHENMPTLQAHATCFPGFRPRFRVRGKAFFAQAWQVKGSGNRNRYRKI